jgi:hypothetical protein
MAQEVKSQRLVAVEFVDGVPDQVVVEEECRWRPSDPWATERRLYFIDNCGSAAEPDLYYDHPGGSELELGASGGDLWWDGDPPGDFEALGGYRRVDKLPEYMPVGDPFRYMIEGRTVWCEICKRRYPDQPEHATMGFADIDGYDVVRAAARWLAGRVVREMTASRWDPAVRENDGWTELGRGWRGEVEGQFQDRIEHEADRHAEKESGNRFDVRKVARENFSALVRQELRHLADQLEENHGSEEVEHLCPHLWWEDSIGWTGPGAGE